MVILTDNDILFKLGACNLLGAFPDLFGVHHKDIYILPTAKPVLQKSLGRQARLCRWKDRISAERLARAAKVHGDSLHVDPGVLLLNYAYNEFVKTGDQDIWRYVGQALNVWSLGDNAPDSIRQMMQQRLDLPNLPDDSAEFLLRLCSIDPETVGI